jgi:Eukaryotic-type carbonic anhydrase
LNGGRWKPEKMFYCNDEQGIVCNYYYKGRVLPTLKGGPLTGPYNLEHVRFYWPGNHFVDGIGSDAEVYLTFYNSQEGSFEEASKKEEGLAIVGIRFKVSKIS